MHSTFLTHIFTAILLALTLVGCGSSAPEPTPTPTKTPSGQGETQAVVAAATTASPTVAPPTVVLPTATAPDTAPATPTPRPANIAPYTGLPVADSARLGAKPLLVCVNNDSVGRTVHEGLSQADLIYEYIVDGFTTTRLIALYHSQDATSIRPIRSARFPNIWMAYMYDGVLACSGGTDEIRYILKNEVGFPYLDADIDDPSNNRYFQNNGDDYRTRLGISTAGIRRWVQDNGLGKAWNRPGFQFSEAAPDNAAGSAEIVRIPYPGGNSVEWRYDAGQRGYLRFQGGQQGYDLATGTPILAQNILVISAQHELTDIVEDSLGTKSVDIELYGFGDFRIFRDGSVYEGTWRADNESPPRWLGPGEVIVQLRPGQSWIQVVREIVDLSYE